MKSFFVWREIALGATTIALADTILFSLYWRDPKGIFQYIAAGILGRETAFSGGWTTASIGVALHVLIAFGFVIAFFAFEHVSPILRKHPYVAGPAFGILAYSAMNFVVIPLSRLGTPTNKPPLSWQVSDLLFHVAVVGLVCSHCYQRAMRS